MAAEMPLRFEPIDKLLAPLLAGMWRNLLSKGHIPVSWNLTEAIIVFRRINDQFSEIFEQPVKVLSQSHALMRACQSRRVADMVAVKATSQVNVGLRRPLPDELALMVADALSSERDIKMLMG